MIKTRGQKSRATVPLMEKNVVFVGEGRGTLCSMGHLWWGHFEWGTFCGAVCFVRGFVGGTFFGNRFVGCTFYVPEASITHLPARGRFLICSVFRAVK
jgi:hypothetical protein